MALLPEKPQSPTVTAIYAWHAGKLSPPRAYLGGSVIGKECERALWYGFRWAYGGEQFDGRMIRLFERGQREEAVFVQELRAIGCEVYDIDPATGEQFRFKSCGGHVAGGLDGVVKGVPEAPRAYHVLECKTLNSKSFATLQRDGVQKAKPEHYAQMTLYMRWSQLDRALYLAVNKDTDELYAERVHLDATFADALEAKAERVVFAQEPPARLSEDAAFFKCKFCPAAAVCHGVALPAVSCRTCLHATPEREGDGRWTCAKWGADIPLDAQRRGCGEHLYIPALLKRWGEATDASEAEGWVEYTAADGFVFRNGKRGPGCYESTELAASTPALLRDEATTTLRDAFDGRIVQGEAA